MLPEIAELEYTSSITNEDLPKTGKSFLFDFETGDFVLKDGKLIPVDGVDALRIWIEKVLRTEKLRFEIYSEEYGVSLEDLIVGQNLPIKYIESEIKREVTEALLKNELITSVTDWQIKRKDSSLQISFTVNNSFTQEVSI